MKRIVALVLTLLTGYSLAHGQDTVKPRPLSLDEYNKARAFEVKDLDAETYVKFEGVYILDRYEMRKPYYVTGDDGLRKRFDLYKLLVKPDMDELGLMIYYTNEKGTRYGALLPNFTAPAEVWERYFEDIHAIDKKEQNFVLKLSYIISKELGFQFYKSVNSDKDFKKESATYGNDICFPADQWVTLSSGERKTVGDLSVGDEIIVGGAKDEPRTSIVTAKPRHEPKRYALTEVVLFAEEQVAPNELHVSFRKINATPNHPIDTQEGSTQVGRLKEGDIILCPTDQGDTRDFVVWSVVETTHGEQAVYSIECADDLPILINNVPVRQK